tara:strand:- start:401 stop:652 length:252 start_codon:yes stop_codon:yes gene_type:complete
MNDAGGMKITLLAFGPLAETLNWKRHELTVPHSTKIDAVLRILEIDEWKSQGLLVAINGLRCGFEAELGQGDELALLPPVSGG